MYKDENTSIRDNKCHVRSWSLKAKTTQEKTSRLRSLELLVGVGVLVAAASAEHIEVVLLEEAKVLTGLAELVLLHTLSDVPVHEGPLAVHEVELSDNALAEDTADRDVVSDHRAVDRGGREVVALHGGRGLVVEANLVSGGAPVDERQPVVVLQPLDDGVRVLRLDVSSVQEGHGHVLIL